MEAARDLKEKRKHQRVNMDLPLEYRVLDTPQPRAHGGLVINASESGLRFHSVKDMPVGTKLNIAVLFPQGYELANFEVLAEVVWKDICWQENRKEYELGLKFIRIWEEDHQKLKRLLAEGRDT